MTLKDQIKQLEEIANQDFSSWDDTNRDYEVRRRGENDN